ncbi:hypothetical protein RGQ29_003168 [Quercus rubra]|uniref:Thioesterase domain-containing protein n=1 Tax=Quercus rubra TaxID=3512 RepID=A0AAN7EBS0_QUERU|nr:hypothetical protein RGQ29_003168 [Quercus rubra]
MGYKKQCRDKNENKNASTINGLPLKFFERFIMQDLRVDHIELGRLILDLVGSAVIYSVGTPATRVSVEINVSYLDAAFTVEEIEIEARVLHVGKAISVVNVEFRKKETGKIIAQGRHMKYLPATSKM